MPGLVAFGHKWGVGSDDLAVPAAFEATASGAWLAGFGRTLIWKYGHLASVAGGTLVRNLLVGGALLSSVNLILCGCLIHTSFKGTLINPGPRKHAGQFLALKLVYGGASVCLSLSAFHLIFIKDLASTMTPDMARILRNSSRGLWGTTLVSSFVLWHILNPNKRKQYTPHDASHPNVHDLEKSESVQEAMQATWKERFHSLGKFLGIEGHPALNKVGRLFSEYLQEENNLDLVATDVVAALMVLEKEQKNRFERLARKSPSLGLTMPDPPVPLAWMSVGEAAHYMKYAAGCYGWPMYIWSSPLALWGLMKVLIRSRYLPRQLPDNVVGDNALMANTTVIKMVTGLTDEELVHVSFHNKLFEVPFYIAVDYEQKAIVVAIRGTLSLEDILTDLSAYDDRPVDLPGVSEGSVHEGMYYAADYIRRRLLGEDTSGEPVETGLLEKAAQHAGWEHAKDYKLVIVGHSLGAGVAGVLALMMHEHSFYGPRLQCFAYSPPGGLMSLSASKYAERCVCSVVLGDDLVSRLGINNLYELKVRVLKVIKNLDEPKHHIFQGWFRNLLSTTLGVSESGLAPTKDKHSWSGDPEQQAVLLQFQRSLQRAIDYSEERIAHHRQMYPPGCVLYVEDVRGQGHSDCRFAATIVPADSYLFGEIIFSKTIISDHTPWAVLSALRTLADQQPRDR